jgi:hypothetical protein
MIDSGQKRRRAKTNSDAMKRRAIQLACPACARRNALTRHVTECGCVYVCRWCKHEHGTVAPIIAAKTEQAK